MIYIKIFKSIIQSTILKIRDVIYTYIDKKFINILPKNII